MWSSSPSSSTTSRRCRTTLPRSVFQHIQPNYTTRMCTLRAFVVEHMRKLPRSTTAFCGSVRTHIIARETKLWGVPTSVGVYMHIIPSLNERSVTHPEVSRVSSSLVSAFRATTMAECWKLLVHCDLSPPYAPLGRQRQLFVSDDRQHRWPTKQRKNRFGCVLVQCLCCGRPVGSGCPFFSCHHNPCTNQFCMCSSFSFVCTDGTFATL